MKDSITNRYSKMDTMQTVIDLPPMSPQQIYTRSHRQSVYQEDIIRISDSQNEGFSFQDSQDIIRISQDIEIELTSISNHLRESTRENQKYNKNEQIMPPTACSIKQNCNITAKSLKAPSQREQLGENILFQTGRYVTKMLKYYEIEQQKDHNRQNIMQRISLSKITTQIDSIIILAIFTSDYQLYDFVIQQINSQYQMEIQYMQQSKYKNKYIYTFIFEAQVKEISSFAIKWKYQRGPSLFYKEQSQEIGLDNTITHQNVGLLFNQLFQMQINKNLINYCLLNAYQFLINNMMIRIKERHNFFINFIKILQLKFHSQDQKIKQIFHTYKINKTNTNSTQFLLYFFYNLYQQESEAKLQSFKLLSILNVNSNIVKKLLKNKDYLKFPNGQCFKDFVLHTYFLYGMQYLIKDYNSMKDIIQNSILYLSKRMSRLVLLRLEQNKHYYAGYIEHDCFNKCLRENIQITVGEYLYIRLKVVYHKIYRLQNEVGAQQSINQLIIQLIQDLCSKSKIHYEHNPNKAEDMNKNYSLSQAMLRKIIFKDNKWRLLPLYISIFYCKIKFIHIWNPALYDFFLTILRPYLLESLCNLLKVHYQTFIYPLVLLPEMPQCTYFLSQFHKNYSISISQFILLLKLYFQGNKRLYNLQSIEDLLLKCLANNPSITKSFVLDFIHCLKIQVSKSKYKKSVNCLSFILKVKQNLKDEKLQILFVEQLQQIMNN